MSHSIIGRYAPSPSGRLHMGNIMSSLLAWLDVRSQDGKLIFRLEDLDPDRSDYDYAALMADDLQWLGLDWDEGWFPGKGTEYTQGARTHLYDEAFHLLQDKNLLYPCYCSRSQRLAASAPHPGEKRDSSCSCRYLSDRQRVELEAKGKKPAWKVIVPDEVIEFNDVHYGRQTENLMEQGDFIIRRSDGVYAYQLAVSVDDADMKISSVVRARDLMSSTFKQIWLIRILGGTIPNYAHCPLLVSEKGRKLSKREGDLNMDTFRNLYSPEQLIGHLGEMCGLLKTYRECTAGELRDLFSWDRVLKEDILINI